LFMIKSIIQRNAVNKFIDEISNMTHNDEESNSLLSEQPVIKMNPMWESSFLWKSAEWMMKKKKSHNCSNKFYENIIKFDKIWR